MEILNAIGQMYFQPMQPAEKAAWNEGSLSLRGKGHGSVVTSHDGAYDLKVVYFQVSPRRIIAVTTYRETPNIGGSLFPPLMVAGVGPTRKAALYNAGARAYGVSLPS